MGSAKPKLAPAAKVSNHILIVSDLPQMKLLRAYLEEESDFRFCGEAIDSFDALDKAQRLKPDLIFLDASMPRMNGIEAAPKLKKLLPQTAIILFTFHEGMMRGFDALELGVDAVVTKASGMFPLKESVKALLEHRHLTALRNYSGLILTLQMITMTQHLSKMEQFWSELGYPISFSMKRSELTNQQKLLVPCPICGAAIGACIVRCIQVLVGAKEAHWEREYYAIQAIEHGYGRYELLRTFIRVETAHIWQGSA
jgi:DNA-binding NarL/FixJ family response regulator